MMNIILMLSFFHTCSTVLVATNKDLLHNDDEVERRKTIVYRQVRRRAEELGLAKVLDEGIIDVNATVDDENNKVRSELPSLFCFVVYTIYEWYIHTYMHTYIHTIHMYVCTTRILCM